jgi:hypothetical protein
MLQSPPESVVLSLQGFTGRLELLDTKRVIMLPVIAPAMVDLF